jgi:hypothetical protein
MVDFVTTWFDEIQREIGLERLIQLFPEYLDVTAKIAAVQDKIAHSRESRGEARDGVYDAIEVGDYDAILALYDKMRLSKDRVQESVRKQNLKEFITFWAVILAGLTGLALVCFEIYKFATHH